LGNKYTQKKKKERESLAEQKDEEKNWARTDKQLRIQGREIRGKQMFKRGEHMEGYNESNGLTKTRGRLT